MRVDRFDQSLRMPRMNGGESQIEILKPFGQAFELMKKTLFQPFDFKKWLVIGFAAWLANRGGGGGVGFNYPYNQREDTQKLNETIGQIPQSVLITGICIFVRKETAFPVLTGCRLSAH